MPPENYNLENGTSVSEILGNWISEATDEDELMDRICQAGDYVHQQRLIRILKSLEPVESV